MIFLVQLRLFQISESMPVVFISLHFNCNSDFSCSIFPVSVIAVYVVSYFLICLLAKCTHLKSVGIFTIVSKNASLHFFCLLSELPTNMDLLILKTR